MKCSRGSTADKHTHAHTSHPTFNFKEHGLIYGLWYGLTPLTKSPTFYCNESKQSHLHNRDYYLPLPQEISFLYPLIFKISHSQLHKGKPTQPYTLTKNCCIPTEQELLECEQSSQPPPQPPGWQAAPAGRLLHQTLFERQTEKASGLASLKSLGCLSLWIIWGFYLCLCK